MTNLCFGDVVDHPLKGRGMIYAIDAKNGLLLIAFEEGCVHTGLQGLSYVGSIYQLPKKSAKET